jgi:hypothetical protein
MRSLHSIPSLTLAGKQSAEKSGIGFLSITSAVSHGFRAIVESVNRIERTVDLVSLKQHIS